jgi:hypothetical protein
LVEDGAKQLINQIAKHFKGFGEAVMKTTAEVTRWILGRLPDVVKTLMKRVLQECLALGADVINMARGVGNAAVAAWDAWCSKDLTAGINPGVPTKVIESVQNQIQAFGIKNFVISMMEATFFTLKITTPVGQVLGSVKTILGYVAELFFHLHATYRLNSIIKDARTQFDQNLADNHDKFSKWYLKVINDMPIISCYCLAMPFTGSYNGFLTVMTKKGRPLSTNKLKKNLKEFERVQAWAKYFVQSHSVAIHSSIEAVQLSIDIAMDRKVEIDIQDKLPDKAQLPLGIRLSPICNKVIKKLKKSRKFKKDIKLFECLYNVFTELQEFMMSHHPINNEEDWFNGRFQLIMAAQDFEEDCWYAQLNDPKKDVIYDQVQHARALKNLAFELELAMSNLDARKDGQYEVAMSNLDARKDGQYIAKNLKVALEIYVDVAELINPGIGHFDQESFTIGSTIKNSRCRKLLEKYGETLVTLWYVRDPCEPITIENQ